MNTTFLQRTVLALSFVAIVGSLPAQDIDTLKTWSVEEFGQKLTDQMIPRVPLNPDQIDQVHKINLKFAGQVIPVVNGAEELKSQLDVIRGFDRQRTNELEIFLGAEQMRQVRQIQTENRKKMKQHYYERHGSAAPRPN
jgi:hypothetical protein